MAGGFFNYGSFAGPVELEPIYALVDLETSGFNPPQAKILEIAILKIDAQGKVLDQFSTLIDPGDNNVGRTEIHGITLEMIKKAPSFADVRGQVLEILGGAILVAHNAMFEERFLEIELADATPGMPMVPAIDTLWLARQTLSLPDYKLDTVVRSFDQTIDNAHTAMGDVLAMAKFLPQMLAKTRTIKFESNHRPLPSFNSVGKARPR